MKLRRFPGGAWARIGYGWGMRRLLAVLCLLGTSACQGPRLLPANEAGAARGTTPPALTSPATTRPGSAPQPRRVWAGPPCPPPRRGTVQLRKVDLRGVEAWLGDQTRRWILGDVVDVYASKEFFSQTLTLTEKAGFVLRQDQRFGQDLVVTLTYIGQGGGQSAEFSPRVLIGTDMTEGVERVTGLTVSARKVLRVRLAKTNNPRRPVQLRIVAHGKAVQGRMEQVDRRDEEQIVIGGYLQHDGARWVWNPVGE